MGNFVTLTNVDEEEMRRIVRRRASPCTSASTQPTPQVRRRMMRNPHAQDLRPACAPPAPAGRAVPLPDRALPRGERRRRAGKDADRPCGAAPGGQSSRCAVGYGLPAGARSPLLPPSRAEEAERPSVPPISRWQKKCWKEMGTRFVFASDEFYCLAGRSIPAESCYEDFPQIENGVGLLRRFECELEEAERFEVPDGPAPARRYLIPTGVSAAPHLMRMAERFAPPGVSARVLPVANHFLARRSR